MSRKKFKFDRSSESLPDWGHGDRRDFVKLNEGVLRDFGNAARQLETAWGRGGSQGFKGV